MFAHNVAAGHSRRGSLRVSDAGGSRRSYRNGRVDSAVAESTPFPKGPPKSGTPGWHLLSSARRLASSRERDRYILREKERMQTAKPEGEERGRSSKTDTLSHTNEHTRASPSPLLANFFKKIGETYAKNVLNSRFAPHSDPISLSISQSRTRPIQLWDSCSF